MSTNRRILNLPLITSGNVTGSIVLPLDDPSDNLTKKINLNQVKDFVLSGSVDNNYYTSQEMNTGKPDAGYELQDTEQNIINQSQKTVDDFIQDSAALDKAKAEADKAKQSDIEDDLLNQIKNCQ